MLAGEKWPHDSEKGSARRSNGFTLNRELVDRNRNGGSRQELWELSVLTLHIRSELLGQSALSWLPFERRSKNSTKAKLPAKGSNNFADPPFHGYLRSIYHSVPDSGDHLCPHAVRVARLAGGSKKNSPIQCFMASFPVKRVETQSRHELQNT